MDFGPGGKANISSSAALYFGELVKGWGLY